MRIAIVVLALLCVGLVVMTQLGREAGTSVATQPNAEAAPNRPQVTEPAGSAKKKEEPKSFVEQIQSLENHSKPTDSQ
ncbi:MAG: hypothetical protein MI751_17785 [Pseudomonadales bacterium]|uniref:hypothetical protein n=1 Tax=Alcanivorax sp. MD8A TaxID=1177157 RepID=UPI000C9CF379|nr:hypothetical protein [Alcanivorax sp. MD8A]MCG8439935.1 hypothetical protein [Pseudomonadales bacterium]PNE02186.1 hypothetical protein A15D_02284 [Alcanivorax sp. MD8A]